LGSLVSELREEMGKQTRKFVCDAAKKRVGEKMLSCLEIEIDQENPLTVLDICRAIRDRGGPNVTCIQKNDMIQIEIHECHLIEAAQMEPYVCEITQGWIEAMLFAAMGDTFVVEREHTIAEGENSCIFKCKKNYQAVLDATVAIKRIQDLQPKINDKLILIFEFAKVREFNEFSFALQNRLNAEIRNVSMHQGKYIAEVIVYRDGLSRLQ